MSSSCNNQKPHLPPTPRSLIVDITTRCNLRCSYCYHFDSAADVKGDLPTEDWLIFFQEAQQGAVLDIALGGGEPFLHPDIKEIIQGIVDNRMRFMVMSNGTLINDELAAFLAGTHRCNVVQVSIDGSNDEIHGFCRGKGTFQKALEGIRSLQRYNVPVTVRVTLHRRNVADLENVARLLLEDLKLETFSTNDASYMGLCRSNTDVQLSSQDRNQAMAILLKLDKRYPGRIQATAGPMAEAKTWWEMVRAFREGREPFPEKGALTACGGVYNNLGVTADGVMVPCIQMPHLKLGRINRDDLRTVWREHPELKRLRERRRIPLHEFSFCRDCDYEPYCTGDCPAISFTTTGDENRPSPHGCLKRFLDSGGRLPDDPF